MNAILRHFDHHRRRSRIDFFFRMLVEGLLPPLIIAFVIDHYFPFPARKGMTGGDPYAVAADILVIAPLLETLFFQALAVRVAQFAKLGFWGQIMWAWIPFAAVHFLVSWRVGVFAGLYSGFYFAFTYVRWKEVSFRTAFWMTAGIHFVHNALLFSAGLADGSFNR